MALGSRHHGVPGLASDYDQPREQLLARNGWWVRGGADEREAQLTQVNGRLYAIAKVQSDKSCPLVASAPPSSVVR
jgi:hypothetical protein